MWSRKFLIWHGVTFLTKVIYLCEISKILLKYKNIFMEAFKHTQTGLSASFRSSAKVRKKTEHLQKNKGGAGKACGHYIF